MRAKRDVRLVTANEVETEIKREGEHGDPMEKWRERMMKTETDRERGRGWREMELWEERGCQGASAASGARPPPQGN